MSDILRHMNLTPVADHIVESIKAIEDYMNAKIAVLNENGPDPVNPEDFTTSMHNCFCDLLESTQATESAVEAAIEKLTKSYTNRYNSAYGLANVYSMQEYRDKRDKLAFNPAKYTKGTHDLLGALDKAIESVAKNGKPIE